MRTCKRKCFWIIELGRNEEGEEGSERKERKEGKNSQNRCIVKDKVKQLERISDCTKKKRNCKKYEETKYRKRTRS